MEKSSGPYYFHVGISPKQGAAFPIFAVAEFENPTNPAKPLIKEGRMNKPGDVISLKSPYFRQRPENRAHTVIVRFYSDASRRQKVDELTQQFLPSLPSEQDLRRAGLEHLVD